MLIAKNLIPFVLISDKRETSPMRDVLDTNRLNAVDSTIQTPTI